MSTTTGTNNSGLKKIYDKSVKDGYKGSYDDFETYFNASDDNRKKVYDKNVKNGYKGSYDDFISFAGQPSSPASQQSSPTDYTSAMGFKQPVGKQESLPIGIAAPKQEPDYSAIMSPQSISALDTPPMEAYRKRQERKRNEDFARSIGLEKTKEQPQEEPQQGFDRYLTKQEDKRADQQAFEEYTREAVEEANKPTELPSQWDNTITPQERLDKMKRDAVKAEKIEKHNEALTQLARQNGINLSNYNNLAEAGEEMRKLYDLTPSGKQDKEALERSVQLAQQDFINDYIKNGTDEELKAWLMAGETAEALRREGDALQREARYFNGTAEQAADLDKRIKDFEKKAERHNALLGKDMTQRFSEAFAPFLEKDEYYQATAEKYNRNLAVSTNPLYMKVTEPVRKQMADNWLAELTTELEEGRPNWGNIREFAAAADILKDTRAFRNAANKNGLSTGLRSAYNALADWGNATWGVADAANQATVNDVMKKLDKEGYDKLEPAEQALVDAVAVQDLVQGLYNGDVNQTAWGMGETTAQMAQFIAELYVSGGLSGAARGAVKGGIKQGFKGIGKGWAEGWRAAQMSRQEAAQLGRIANKYTNKSALEVAKNIGKKALKVTDTGLSYALTTGAGHSVTNTLEYMAPELDFDYDFNTGEATYNGAKGGDRLGIAASKGFGKQAIEGGTEVMGDEFFEPMVERGGAWLMRALGKGGRSAYKPYLRVVDDWVGGGLLKNIQGYGIEYGEELAGSTLRALTGISSWDEEFNKENLAQTAYGLMPAQIGFAMLGGGRIVGHNRRASRARALMEKYAPEQQDFYNRVAEMSTYDGADMLDRRTLDILETIDKKRADGSLTKADEQKAAAELGMIFATQEQLYMDEAAAYMDDKKQRSIYEGITSNINKDNGKFTVANWTHDGQTERVAVLSTKDGKATIKANGKKHTVDAKDISVQAEYTPEQAVELAAEANEEDWRGMANEDQTTPRAGSIYYDAEGNTPIVPGGGRVMVTEVADNGDVTFETEAGRQQTMSRRQFYDYMRALRENYEETAGEIEAWQASETEVANTTAQSDNAMEHQVAGQAARDVERLLAQKIGADQVALLSRMDVEGITRAYLEAEDDTTRSLISAWLQTRTGTDYHNAMAKRKQDAVAGFKQSIGRLAYDNSGITIAEYNGNTVAVESNDGSNAVVVGLDGSKTMVPSASLANMQPSTIDAFAEQAVAPQLQQADALERVYDGTVFNEGQVYDMGIDKDGKPRKVAVVSVNPDGTISYATNYGWNKDGSLKPDSRSVNIVSAEDFRDMIETANEEAVEKAEGERQAAQQRADMGSLKAGQRVVIMDGGKPVGGVVMIPYTGQQAVFTDTQKLVNFDTMDDLKKSMQDAANALQTEQQAIQAAVQQQKQAEIDAENAIENEYQKRFEAAKTPKERAQVIQEYLDQIKTEDFTMITNDNLAGALVESMVKRGIKQEDAIRLAKQIQSDIQAANKSQQRVRGFNHPYTGICIHPEDIVSIEDARTTYVHERQHTITRNNVSLQAAVLQAASKDELDTYIAVLSGTPFYKGKDNETVASEFLSMAMEVAYKSSDVGSALRQLGIKNDALIQIITQLDNEQRTDEHLSKSRRTAHVDGSQQGDNRNDDENKGRESGRMDGQGSRPVQRSGKPTASQEVKTPEQLLEAFIAKHGDNTENKLNKTIESISGDIRNLEKKLATAEQELKDLPEAYNDKAKKAIDKKEKFIEKVRNDLEAARKALAPYTAMKEVWDGRVMANQTRLNEADQALQDLDGNLNPTVEAEEVHKFDKEPANADEAAADFLVGFVKKEHRINEQSLMQETGWSEDEVKNFRPATTPDGGITLQEAAESLYNEYESEGSEHGWFKDPSEARDKLISVMQEAGKYGELTNYINQRRGNDEATQQMQAALDANAQQLGYADAKDMHDKRMAEAQAKLEELKDPQGNLSEEALQQFKDFTQGLMIGQEETPAEQPTESIEEGEEFIQPTNDEAPFSVVTGNSSEEEQEETYFGEEPRYSVVTDPQLLEELNNGKTVKVYRAMQMQDGRLYPPMAGKINGEWQTPSEAGQWMQADEHPELVDDKGRFVLNKGNGKTIKAKYNPYWHTSRSPLNDQFSSAWSRPELVTVEVEIPESELTSGYKANKAKDAVGEMDWHSGPVSSQLSKKGNPRKVILSRYNRLVRVVPNEEVAERIAEMLGGTNIKIPFNTVTPELRQALEAQGVKIGKPQKGNAGDASMDAYNEWNGGTRYSITGLITNEQGEIDYDRVTNLAKSVTQDNKGSVLDGQGNDARRIFRVPSVYLESSGVPETAAAIIARGDYETVGAQDKAAVRVAQMPQAVSVEDRRGSEASRQGGDVQGVRQGDRGNNNQGQPDQGGNGTSLGNLADTIKSDIEAWAKSQGYWYDDARLTDGFTEIKGGTESRVFVNEDKTRVRKLTSFTPAYSDYMQRLVENIGIFNTVFPESRYDIVGFGQDKDGNLALVVEQPLVDGYSLQDYAEQNGITDIEDLVDDIMERRGFLKYGYGTYTNGEVYVSDIIGNNILLDSKGQPYIIDAVTSLDAGAYSEPFVLYSVITPQQDADYMDAVNRGDMETAQRMVNEAAKAAMPNTKVVDENGNPLVVYHSFDNENYNSGLVFASANENYSREFGDNTDRVYINLTNPYITEDGILRDADGKEVMYEGEPASIGYLDSVNDDYLNWLQSNYDGVMDKDMEFVVAFNPNQIKSADPVTYDDQGNVIPLSERFNEGNDDIRYSIVNEQGELNYEELDNIIRGQRNELAGLSRIPEEAVGRAVATPAIAAEAIARGVRQANLAKVWGEDRSREHTRELIKQWAKQSGHWYDEARLTEDATEGRGGTESRVFVTNNGKTVRKLTSPVFSQGNVEPYIESLHLFGNVFGESAYDIKGFGENDKGELCVVIEQPYIQGVRLSDSGITKSIDKIREFMESLGFKEYGVSMFENDKYRVEDVNRTNVIVDTNGDFHVIDAYVSLADESLYKEEPMYSFVGRSGAQRLDMADRAMTRLNNLHVAREMEEQGKDAKAVKMATGWERGKDGKWRYEISEASMEDIVKRMREPILPKIAEIKRLKELARREYEKFEYLNNNIPARLDSRFTEEEKQTYREQRKERDKLLQSSHANKTDAEVIEGELRNDGVEMTLGEILPEGNELLKAYPKLADIKVRYYNRETLRDGSYGRYNDKTNTLFIAAGKERPVTKIYSTLYHEIQHAIQDIEGFAQGGNPQMAAQAVKDMDNNAKIWEYKMMLDDVAQENPGHADSEQELLYDILFDHLLYENDGQAEYNAVRDGWIPEESLRKQAFKIYQGKIKGDSYEKAHKQWYDKLNEAGRTTYYEGTPFELYKRLAGETEARNVQTRLGFTEEQRRQLLAAETEDVAREDQLVMFAGDPVLYSVAKNANTPQERMALYDALVGTKNETSTFVGRTMENAYQYILDGAIPLKRLQTVVAGRNGVKDAENAYLMEIARASRAEYLTDQAEEKYMQPMMDAIADLTGKQNKRGFYKAMRDVELYVLAKSGIERNQWFWDEAKKKDPKAQLEDKSGLTALAAQFGETDFTAFAERLVAEYEAKHGKQKIDNLWNTIRNMSHNILDTERDGMLISAELCEDLKNRWQYYVPMRGFDEDVTSSVYSYDPSSANIRFENPFKKIKGRVSLADNPFVNLWRMTESAINLKGKNEVGLALLTLASNHPDNGLLRVGKSWETRFIDPNTGDEKWMMAYPNLANVSQKDIPAAIDAFQKSMVRMAKTGDARQSNSRTAGGMRIFPTDMDQHTLKVTVAGQSVDLYLMGNPKAFQSLNPKGKNRTAQAMSALTRGLSGLMTTYNPVFMVRNSMRDLGTAMIITYTRDGVGGMATMLGQWFSNANRLRRLISGKSSGDATIDQYWNEFLEFGGETGFTRSLAMEKARDKFMKDMRNATRKGINPNLVFHAYGNWMENYGNRFAEDITRFAVFCASRKNGKSAMQAAADAKNTTANFNKKGNSAFTRFMTSNFAFFNAALQGLNTTFHAYKDNPGRAAVASVSTMAFSMALPFINMCMLALFGDDDDWRQYENMTQFIGNTHLVAYIPKTGFVTLPFPQDFVPLTALGNIIWRNAAGFSNIADERSIAGNIMLEWASTMADLLPVNMFEEGFGKIEDWEGVARAVAPTWLSPVADVMLNRNFMGSMIRRKHFLANGQKDLKPYWAEYDRNKSEWAYELAKLIAGGDEYRAAAEWRNIDPRQIIHIVEGYGGGTVKLISDAANYATARAKGENASINQSPFIKKFWIQPQPDKYEGNLNGKLYEMAKHQRDLEQELKALQKEADKAYDDGNDALAEKREKEIERIENSIEYQVLSAYDVNGMMESWREQRNDITADEELSDEGKQEQIRSLTYEKAAFLDGIWEELFLNGDKSNWFSEFYRDASTEAYTHNRKGKEEE